MHWLGDMDADPSLETLPELVRELETTDEEHPDVAVTHDSGGP